MSNDDFSFSKCSALSSSKLKNSEEIYTGLKKLGFQYTWGLILPS